MLIFDPKKRATAADLCQHPIIQRYLTDHGLPGPALSTMLTSPRIIHAGMEVTPVINYILKSKNTIINKMKA